MPPREVARGLLFDDDRRILMIHWRDPVTGKEFFEPPGGQREPHESLVEALRREVAEETGIVDVVVGDFLTELEHSFTFAGEYFDCVEHYFACSVSGRTRTAPRLDEIEESGVLGTRWMTIEELRGLPANEVEPPGLLTILDALELGSS